MKFAGVPQTHNNWTVFLENNTCLNSLLILPHVYVYCTRASSFKSIDDDDLVCACGLLQNNLYIIPFLRSLRRHQGRDFLSLIHSKTARRDRRREWRRWTRMNELDVWRLLSSLLGQQPLESPWFSLLSLFLETKIMYPLDSHCVLVCLPYVTSCSSLLS